MVFVITGFVILAFGIVALFTQDLWVIGGHFGLGLALLGYAGFARLGEIRELFKRGSGRRGLRQGSNAVIQVLALVGLLGLVAYLAGKHERHWDWTEAGEHTLSPATRQILDQISDEKPVQIYAFSTEPEAVRTALDQYAYQSKRVSYTIFDPNRNPVKAQQFEITSDGVLLVCGGTCEAAKGSVRVNSTDETELAKAIRSVISKKRKVYFVNGHGESDPADSTANGLSQIKTALDDENIDSEPLLLANAPSIPEDADALVIAGPQASLLPRELDMLDDFLKGGGSLLITADPILITNLEGRLHDWKIALGNDVIVDERLQLFGAPQLGFQPITSSYGQHPITEKLAGATGRATLYQLARSVEPVDNDESVTRLVLTGDRSWAAADVADLKASGTVKLDPEKDRRGPVSLAVARTFPLGEGRKNARGRSEGRLVVVGDTDFVRNRYVTEFFNADLFVNMTNWLVGEEKFAAIERPTPRASRVVMSPEQVVIFSYIAIFMLPESILLLGIANWWRRRS